MEELEDLVGFSPMRLIGTAVDYILRFCGGDRQKPLLALAFRNIAVATQLRYMSENQIREIWREGRFDEESKFSTKFENIPYYGLRALASTLHEGAEKYGEWNWLYGFPIKDVLSHALEHIYCLTLLDESEDHYGHALCNLMFAIHLVEERPDLMEDMIGAFYKMTPTVEQILHKHREDRRGRA